MNKFFINLWQLIKPINRFHLLCWIIFFGAVITYRMTVPPSKVITDYKQVEGVVIDFSSGYKRRNTVTLQLKNSEQTITMILGGSISEFRHFLGQNVVVYYWPDHAGMGHQLVLMAPIAKKKQYLDDFIKNKGGFDISTLSLYWQIMSGAAFFLLWFIPWCIRGKRLLQEKAFYDILFALAIKYDFQYPEDKLLELAKAVKDVVDDKSKYTDWSHRDDLTAELKADLIILLAKFGYPPVDRDEVYQEIFEQAENF